MTKHRPSLCDALLRRAPVLQELAQRASIALIHMIPENLGIVEQQHRSSRRASVPGTPVVAIPEEAIRLRLDDDLVSAMSAPAARRADLVLVVPDARHILNATHWPMFTLRRIGALLTDGQALAYIFPRASGHDLPRRFSIDTDTLAGRYLSTVIEFSASALPLDIPDRFRMCMAILDDVPPSRVVSVAVPSGEDLRLAAPELARLRAGTALTDHGFALEDPVDWSYGILVEELDVHRRRRRRRRIRALPRLGRLRRLTDVCTILEGSPPACDYLDPCVDASDDDVALVRGDSIARGTITPVPLNSVVPKDTPRLAAGDLVVPVDCKAQVIRDPARVRVAEVRDEDLPLVAASDVLVVRPDDGALDLAERIWLRLFLRTERCWEQLVDGWHVMHWLSPSDFGRILVPFPDAEFLEAVDAVSGARRRFGTWKDQAEAMLVSSVDAQDPATARERLLDSSGVL